MAFSPPFAGTLGLSFFHLYTLPSSLERIDKASTMSSISVLSRISEYWKKAWAFTTPPTSRSPFTCDAGAGVEPDEVSCSSTSTLRFLDSDCTGGREVEKSLVRYEGKLSGDDSSVLGLDVVNCGGSCCC